MSDAPAVYRGSNAYPPRAPGPVVTIGNFDGVHLGHRALVTRAVARARELGVPALVYTFDPFPAEVLRGACPGRLQSLDDRIAALGRAGADEVVVEPFTRAFAERGARGFAEGVLRDRLHASALVVGWDFRFGRGREGTVASLAGWLDVPVEQVPAVQVRGEVVSSSRIRDALSRGDVGLAAALLGRPHEVVGAVGPGDQRGRTLGFPTANVAPASGLVPANGVYAVRALVDGTWRPAVANLGVRPTFGGGDRLLEVHVLDFAGDLYGREVRVAFVGRIRGERAFASADELAACIRADVAAARELLS